MKSIAIRKTWIYFTGVFILGVLIGFFVGVSKESVISTIIPILFTLLGGAGGFYIIKTNLENNDELTKLKLIGQTTNKFKSGFFYI